MTMGHSATGQLRITMAASGNFELNESLNCTLVSFQKWVEADNGLLQVFRSNLKKSGLLSTQPSVASWQGHRAASYAAAENDPQYPVPSVKLRLAARILQRCTYALFGTRDIGYGHCRGAASRGVTRALSCCRLSLLMLMTMSTLLPFQFPST